MTGRTRLLLGLYVVLSAANVALEFGDSRLWSTVTKATLMPLLLAVLVTMTPVRGRRTPSFVAAGLVASWWGDLALTGRGDAWFLAGLGCFLIAQLAYVAGFLPTLRTGPLHSRPVVLLPYVAWWAGLIALLGGDAGTLLIPVAGYGLVLVTMAALATGVHRFTAIGAALFVVSDSLIAVTTFSDRFADLPGAGAVIMTTYTAGQLLIVLGVVRREAAVRPGPARTVGAGP